jgi:hypothetical protein
LSCPRPLQGGSHFPGTPHFNTKAVVDILDSAEAALPSKDVLQFRSLSQPLRALAAKWRFGLAGANRDGLVDLLARFLAVESHFGGGGRERRFDDVIVDLRQSIGRCGRACVFVSVCSRVCAAVCVVAP